MKISTEKLRFLTTETHGTKNGSFLKHPSSIVYAFVIIPGERVFELPKQSFPANLP